MSNRTIAFWVVLILVVLLIGYLFYFGLDNNRVGADATSTASESTSTSLDNLGSTATDAMKPQTRTFNMRAGSYFFAPNNITVNSGDLVEIKITAEGGMPHDFTIDEIGVKENLINNRVVVVRFTPEKKGTYTFYCDVGNHRARGMFGTLTVK